MRAGFFFGAFFFAFGFPAVCPLPAAGLLARFFFPAGCRLPAARFSAAFFFATPYPAAAATLTATRAVVAPLAPW